MRCAIWYHLCSLKNMKNTHGGVLILVKLQPLACNFTKINTPLWVFFTFFKWYKWYQIAQRTTYADLRSLVKLEYYYYGLLSTYDVMNYITDRQSHVRTFLMVTLIFILETRL